MDEDTLNHIKQNMASIDASFHRIKQDLEKMPVFLKGTQDIEELRSVSFRIFNAWVYSLEALRCSHDFFEELVGGYEK